MVSFKDFKRTFIPKEISSATESVEDFVRPVTDPVRKFVAKAVPKELKPYASTLTAMLAPGVGSLFANFLLGAGVDAFTQKLMTDPDDEDTDVDYLKAAISGGGKALSGMAKNTSQYRDPNKLNVTTGPTRPLTGPQSLGGSTSSTPLYTANAGLSNVAPNQTLYQQLTGASAGLSPQEAANQAALNFNSGNYLPSGTGINAFTEGASNIANAGLDVIEPYVNPYEAFSGATTSANPLLSTLGATGKTLAGVQAINTPSQVRDASQALLDAENRYQLYLDEQKAKYGADFEEDRQTRIAAYKQYMGLAGYSEDEIDDALRVAGYIGDEETAYAANGGRIGFANGSDSYMGDVYGDRDRDSLDMKEFYKEYPETQVGTYINENRYKSEKIEKLETKLNEIIDMRQRTANRSRNPENDGMPSLMEKLLDKEIKALYADRTNDDLRKTRMQKLEEQQAARQQEAAMRAEQMKAAYQAEFGDGLNRTGRAMGGMMNANMMRPNYNMGGMMNAGMMNNNMMNPRMGYANGSIPDRPNFNYGSGRQTPQGDPIAPNMPPGMQMDLRPGGFIELGTEPRADDVPAMVGKDEFVLNDRAVAGIGKLITGQPDARAGARALYDLQNKMEATV